MSLEVNVRQDGGVTVVAISGPADAELLSRVLEGVEVVLSGGPVVIDVGGLDPDGAIAAWATPDVA
jgi:hypothetical protein